MIPRLASYIARNGSKSRQVGLLMPNLDIIPLSPRDDRFSTMESVVEYWNQSPDMKNLVDETCAEIQPNKLSFSEKDFDLLPPLIPRRNVMCVGKNYTDHIAEVAAVKEGELTSAPKYPVFFTKAPETVIGHGDTIPSHANLTKWLDYEVELGVVIGKKGKDIASDDVLSHIFGYTIGNDVTARELQKSHLQWFKGKSLDGTCPMGPAIVPACYLDATDLQIRCWVNGDLRQDSRTNRMIFNVTDILNSLSAGFTLLPGDIILTGTPDGVGFAMNPPQVLKAGDRVEMEIENIGLLSNIVM